MQMAESAEALQLSICFAEWNGALDRAARIQNPNLA